MCEEHVGQCFVLRTLHRLPSHSSVLTFCFPNFVASLRSQYSLVNLCVQFVFPAAALHDHFLVR